jgi:hypothetical protein
MRLGKRERAHARAKAAARVIAKSRVREPEGNYASMWHRLRGAGRPVGKPKVLWHWNWKFARSVRLGRNAYTQEDMPEFGTVDLKVHQR